MTAAQIQAVKVMLMWKLGSVYCRAVRQSLTVDDVRKADSAAERVLAELKGE